MKKLLPILLVLLIAVFPVFSQEASADDFLAQGLQAYKDGDWNSAITLLKKANSMEQTKGPETLYMLIMSEMFKGEYHAVLAHSAEFQQEYPTSSYRSYVEYEMGRAYYYTGNYKVAIDVFARFCNQNEKDKMFPSALFWMGECLYQTYHFEEAKGIFERIVNFYPDSAKYTEALYRLDLIKQREKEEKLLYLLKVTGEEFLASKNDFERELRKYKTEDNVDLKAQLDATREQLADTEKALKVAKEENEMLKNQNNKLKNQVDSNNNLQNSVNKEQIEALKRKANKVKTIMDEESK